MYFIREIKKIIKILAMIFSLWYHFEKRKEKILSNFERKCVLIAINKLMFVVEIDDLVEKDQEKRKEQSLPSEMSHHYVGKRIYTSSLQE